jgi:hypothetical protein
MRWPGRRCVVLLEIGSRRLNLCGVAFLESGSHAFNLRGVVLLEIGNRRLNLRSIALAESGNDIFNLAGVARLKIGSHRRRNQPPKCRLNFA